MIRSVETSKQQSFEPTRWSLVARLRGNPDAPAPEARQALSELCKLYWYPLYAFVRRKGCSPHDAEDLTQQFFVRLIEKNAFATADRDRGKLRTFLLASLNNFLTNEWKKAQTRKRGGGVTAVSIDAEEAEHRYRNEPAEKHTPETLFDRRWAMTVLEIVMLKLGSEYESSDKATLFDTLKPFLAWEEGTRSYADAAAALDTTEGAVRVAVHRLRKRYREVLRREIADTLETRDPVELGHEIAHLFKALE